MKDRNLTELFGLTKSLALIVENQTVNVADQLKTLGNEHINEAMSNAVLDLTHAVIDLEEVEDIISELGE